MEDVPDPPATVNHGILGPQKSLEQDITVNVESSRENAIADFASPDNDKDSDKDVKTSNEVSPIGGESTGLIRNRLRTSIFLKSKRLTSYGPHCERVKRFCPTDGPASIPLATIQAEERYKYAIVPEANTANVFSPESSIHKFSCLDQDLVRAACVRNFTQLTRIQVQTIQELLPDKTDRDIFCESERGSGKTLAYLIPLLHRLFTLQKTGEEQVTYEDKSEPLCNALAFILSPVRESAQQIFDLIVDLTRFNDKVQPVLIYGGTEVELSSRLLAKGAQIVIATPGRLKHMMELKSLSGSRARFMILDEAEDFARKRWQTQLTHIFDHLNDDCCYWMFTSKFGANSKKTLVSRYLGEGRNPASIPVINVHGEAHLREPYINIQHVPTRINKENPKIKRLAQHFQSEYYVNVRTLILTKSAETAMEVANIIMNDFGIPAAILTGCHHQLARELAFDQFQQQFQRVLVSTFQLGRLGLKFSALPIVILWDMPADIHQYMTAVGRVGRMGAHGLAKVYFDDDLDKSKAPYFCDHLDQINQHVGRWLRALAVGTSEKPQENNDTGDDGTRNKKHSDWWGEEPQEGKDDGNNETEKDGHIDGSPGETQEDNDAGNDGTESHGDVDGSHGETQEDNDAGRQRRRKRRD